MRCSKYAVSHFKYRTLSMLSLGPQGRRVCHSQRRIRRPGMGGKRKRCWQGKPSICLQSMKHFASGEVPVMLGA